MVKSIKVIADKDSLGRFNEIILEGGKIRGKIQFFYGADRFPNQLVISGSLSPSLTDVLNLLNYVDRIRGEGTSVQTGDLKGEDNTTRDVTDLEAYTLAGTVILYNVKEENPLTELYWNLKRQGGATAVWGKITVASTNPTIAAQTEGEESTTETDYQVYINQLSREWYGQDVTVKLYMKVTAAPGVARNNALKLYGKITEVVEYL